MGNKGGKEQGSEPVPNKQGTQAKATPSKGNATPNPSPAGK